MKITFFSVLVIILMSACSIKIQTRKDNQDPLQVRFREMHSKCDCKFVVFESGFKDSSEITVSVRDSLLYSGFISTKRASGVAKSVTLPDNILKNKRILLTLNRFKYRIKARKRYQNIKIRFDDKGKRLIIVYDNNFSFYE
jgi:hypothetical protein